LYVVPVYICIESNSPATPYAAFFAQSTGDCASSVSLLGRPTESNV